MGYCIGIELRNVKFNKNLTKQVVGKLQELNTRWCQKSDWCRFDSNLEDIKEIIEDIGFSTIEEDGYIKFEYFEREKLGDHENMFKSLAPFLEDCEIVYEGEDGDDWKQVIKAGEVSVVTREKL